MSDKTEKERIEVALRLLAAWEEQLTLEPSSPKGKVAWAFQVIRALNKAVGGEET